MDIKDRAKYLARVAIATIKEDGDLEKAMEEALQSIEEKRFASTGAGV